MTKDEFIGNYLTKHMKNHGLPYGKAYFNLLEETEKKGELAWKRFLKRYGKMEKEKITAEQFFCLKMAELYAEWFKAQEENPSLRIYTDCELYDFDLFYEKLKQNSADCAWFMWEVLNWAIFQSTYEYPQEKYPVIKYEGYEEDDFHIVKFGDTYIKLKGVEDSFDPFAYTYEFVEPKKKEVIYFD